MKKLITTILLLLSPLIAAQEKAVWNCRTLNFSGIEYKSQDWVVKTYENGSQTIDFIVVVDAEDSLYGRAEYPSHPIHCENVTYYTRCNDIVGGSIILDNNTGIATVSELLSVKGELVDIFSRAREC